MSKKRVIVVGSGPAGLAAATRLLERARDRVDVKLIHMGHHLGGKAASYKDQDGHTVEHGWHMIVGFYREMRALMRRAGIDEKKTLRSMQGKSHVYESFDQRIHNIESSRSRLRFSFDFLGYDGLPAGDRLNYARFMAQAYLVALSRADLTVHDDICFRTWAIERGLRPHISNYSLFRFLREAYFNYPEAISAYQVLKTMSLMNSAETAELFVVAGGYSERVWQPIADYFRRLGGTIEDYNLVTDWIYNGREIVGMRVGAPDGAAHSDGKSSWKTAAIPTRPETVRIRRDFDYVISTIPHAVFVKMNRDDRRMWASPYFSRLKNLRSGSTISMTARLRTQVAPFPGPIFGLPAPLGIAVNMTPYWDEYGKDPKLGTALHFVGQEAGFEDWTDREIIDFTLDNFSRVGQVGDLRRAGIDSIEFHRNRSDFERLVLCEPGVQQFRPGPLTPFHNLFLAGDWVRNEVDVICMEGAIRSGIQAADELLSRMNP